MTGPDSGPRSETTRTDDRGQAYTLESLVSAIVLVTAVLFALQSVVILPSSAGTLDRDVQGQLHQESSDLLVTAANDGELSRLLRYWADDNDDGNWTFADDPGYAGEYQETVGGYQTELVPVQDLGSALNYTIRGGDQYNLIVAYEDEDGDRQTRRLVYQGSPTQEVITASYTVTLTDGQPVTGPGAGDTTIGEAEDDVASDSSVPIPNRYPGSPVYNVVEVRLILW